MSRKGIPIPGEHHFVSVYLIPKIHAITGLVPEYVNPDGTKNITGDLIYSDGSVCFEVKYKYLRFTRTQYYDWIRNESGKKCPNYLIGLSGKGLLVQEWDGFVNCFSSSIWERDKIDFRFHDVDNYSPSISIDKYVSRPENNIRQDEYFSITDNKEQLLEAKLVEIFKTPV